MFKGMNMLRIAIASLFTKNTKFATPEKIQGSSGNTYSDGQFCLYYS